MSENNIEKGNWQILREYVYSHFSKVNKARFFKESLACKLFLLKQIYKHRIDTFERGWNTTNYFEHIKEMEYIQKWIQNLQFLIQRKTFTNYYYVNEIFAKIKKSFKNLISGCGISNLLFVFDIMLGSERFVKYIFKKDIQNWIYYLQQDFKIISVQSKLQKKKPQILFKNKSHINFYDKMNMIDFVFYTGKYEYVLSGYLMSDPILLTLDCFSPLHEKMTFLKILYNKEYEQKIPLEYAENYFQNISFRDILLYSVTELMEILNKHYNEYKINTSKPVGLMVKRFISSNLDTKYKILYSYLLAEFISSFASSGANQVVELYQKELVSVHLFELLDTNDIYLSGVGASANLSEDKPIKRISEVLPHPFLLFLRKLAVKKETTSIEDHPNSYHQSILLLPDKAKQKGLEKWKEMNSGKENNSKSQTYLDALLKIPFYNYIEESIFKISNTVIHKIQEENSITTEFTYSDLFTFARENAANPMAKLFIKLQEVQKKYFEYVDSVLDASIYGHKPAKRHIHRILSQWISSGKTDQIPVFGLQGPPGVGKTTLIKQGLSKCLTDFIHFNEQTNEITILQNTKFRPFSFIALGGSANGSTIEGHNYTYHGSTWGRIVDILIDAKCMNPIIYIDELDKVSKTEHGKEIIGILTHLTDPGQNDHFNDKFFSGIPLDLSRAIFVFSYNDSSLIDPILRDRITEIRLSPIYNHEKIIVAKNYIIPEIHKSLGWSLDKDRTVILPDDLLEYIIEKYTYESGVRKLKERLYEIYMELNLHLIQGMEEFPYVITQDFITKVFENRLCIKRKNIHLENKVGQINGMYASQNGGGITIIQVKKIHHKNFLELLLTGQQGDVMKESMHVAKTVAWNLLSHEIQMEILATWKDVGIHLHCPEGATPKDGPSAGGAITLAILSAFLGVPIRKDIAMTGEIELNGNITAIGGLDMKLYGAKKAGVRLAFIPEENRDLFENTVEKIPNLIDDDFQVCIVSHLSQVFERVFDDPKESYISKISTPFE